MSVRVRVKVLAAAVALCLAGGASAMVTLNADAATPECGVGCTDIYSAVYGTSARPGYVLDVQGGGEKVGTPVILARASLSNPAEDFTLGAPLLASDLFEAGLIGYGLALRYGCLPDVIAATCPAGAVDDYAVEIQYAPYGAPTGDCVGVATSPTLGTPLTLQPCGVTGRTFWLINPVKPPATPPTGQTTGTTCGLDFFNGLAALINGGTDSSVTDPYAMMVTSANPGLPVFTFPLARDYANQLWGANVGDIGATCTTGPTVMPT